MTLPRIVKLHSRAGRRLLAQLADRRNLVVDAATRKRVREIVQRVRSRGDRALLAAVRRYDHHSASSVAELRFGGREDPTAGAPPPDGFEEALERAIGAVERFHRHQVRSGTGYTDEGLTVEERRIPLRRVGIYVPGGRATYPSTLVMTAIPARLAGVEQIVMATPPDAWLRSSALRTTARRLGIDEIWGMGGAHAIAALAFGTETVPRVDKIVGPGGAWVTAAKEEVAGMVGLDGLAGPTEVVIVATHEADPELVASDLLAQAEHDPLAAALLVTPDRELATAVAEEVRRQLETLETAATATASLQRFGATILVRDLEEALDVVEAIAPEHLQLVGRAEELADRVRSAGAVFVGEWTPEVFGDYVAGPSHVLPTCGTARFASALGVDDFIRRSHLVRCSSGAAARWAATAAVLAEAEQLPAHAASALRRMRRGAAQGLGRADGGEGDDE